MIQAGDIGIEVFSDLESAETVWRTLQTEAFMNPHQSFEWLAAWVQAGGLGDTEPPYIVAGFDSDGICLFLLPLTIRTRYGIRVLEWLANDQGNYASALFHPSFLEADRGQPFEKLWPAVLDALPPVDAVHLADQPQDFYVCENPFVALPRVASAEPGHWFVLTPDWRNHYEDRFSSDSRRELGRCERRLNDHGTLNFIHAEKPETRARVFEAMVGQKRAHLAESGIDDILADGAVRAFYGQLMEAPYQTKGLSIELFALCCGDEIVAVNMGLLFQNRFYGLISSTTNGPLRRLSPGSILFLRVVENLAGRGVETFDCGAGSDPQKLRWCTTKRDRFHTLTARTQKGAIYARTLQAGLALKRAIKRSTVLWPIAKEVRRLKGRALGSLST